MVPLIKEVGLSTGDFVLDGDPDPHPRKGRSPQFSAHVYCVHTAAWITMPLGTEVGLGPGDIVLDGDPAPPEKRPQPHTILGPRLLFPNGLTDEDATWYGCRPRRRPHCVRRGPSPLCKRAQQPPSFRSMSIVATVAHFSYC